jgi:hypothetical protein
MVVHPPVQFFGLERLVEPPLVAKETPNRFERTELGREVLLIASSFANAMKRHRLYRVGLPPRWRLGRKALPAPLSLPSGNQFFDRRRAPRAHSSSAAESDCGLPTGMARRSPPRAVCGTLSEHDYERDRSQRT